MSALPSSSEYGGWKQFIAESCWFYSQNLPTVSMLVPRAGLVLALLFTFSSVQSVVSSMLFLPFLLHFIIPLFLAYIDAGLDHGHGV